MLFNRLKEAVLLGWASHLAEQGDVKRALSVVERLPAPCRNKAVVEALRAYLQIVNGKRDEARASIQRSRGHNRLQTPDALFVDTYCDYLDAMLAKRIAEWNHLALELATFSASRRARSLLVVDRPMPFQ